MNKEMLSIMACPKCKGSVKERRDFLVCNKCMIAFPVMEDEVPNMILENAWKMDKARKEDFKHNIKLEKIEENIDLIDEWEDFKIDDIAWGPNSLALSMYLTDNLPGNSHRSLEAGCGSGKWSLLLSELGYNPVLVDFKIHCLLSARNMFKKYRRGGYFVLADIKNLPFREETFDACFNDGTMEHFNRKEREHIIKHMSMLLNRGGIVALGVPNKWNLLCHIFEYLESENHITQELISPSRLEKEIRGQGLAVKKYGTFFIFSLILVFQLIMRQRGVKSLSKVAGKFGVNLISMHKEMARNPIIRLCKRFNYLDKYFGAEIFYIGKRD